MINIRNVIRLLLLGMITMQAFFLYIQHKEINSIDRKSTMLDEFVRPLSAKKKAEQVKEINENRKLAPPMQKNNELNSNNIIKFSDGYKPPVIAYVVSLIKCPDSTHTTGFLDATLVLRHSIDLMSYENKESKSKYSYKMYVIVHKNCEKFAPIFEQIGIEAMIRESPVNKNDIQNKDYRDNVDKEFCCGSAEFIKLYAYTMIQHPIVVHLDMDMILLKPLDDLFDAMLFPADSSERRSAISRLDLEWPDYDKIPDKIDAFFTKDYTSSWPWKIEAPVQAGFLVLRPSIDAFEEYKKIILVGNYTLGNNNTSGWEGMGYGGWIGGKAMQGILPYFYDYRHKGTAVELNCCRHNQVAAKVKWDKRTRKRESYFGKCNRYPRKGTEPDTTCEDCRNTPISRVHSVHYTACRKPWTCAVPETGKESRHQKRKRFNPEVLNITVCFELQKKWFGIRRDLEDRIIRTFESSYVENAQALKHTIVSTRAGKLNQDKYLGYCEEEGKYNALALPKAEEFDLRLVYNLHQSDAYSSNVVSYQNQLKSKMKERLEKLPPPKWPQLDHGTALAISNGMVLGPEWPSNLTTIGK